MVSKLVRGCCKPTQHTHECAGEHDAIARSAASSVTRSSPHDDGVHEDPCRVTAGRTISAPSKPVLQSRPPLSDADTRYEPLAKLCFTGVYAVRPRYSPSKEAGSTTRNPLTPGCLSRSSGRIEKVCSRPVSRFKKHPRFVGHFKLEAQGAELGNTYPNAYLQCCPLLRPRVPRS